MEKHNIDLEKAVLKNGQYYFMDNIPKKLLLKDIMICYFDGLTNKIIPFDIIRSYPIIHTKYIESNDKSVDISVIVCPFTLTSLVIEGIFYPTSYVKNSCLVVSDGVNTFPVIENPPKFTKRYQISVRILRNVFTEYPDCKYMVLNNNIELKPLLNIDYFYNKKILFSYDSPPDQFHPKTLVYLIQYKSSKDHNDRVTIIVGRDANSDKASGFDIKTSGVLNYLRESDEKIIEKFGFVIPLLWFSWKSFYPNSKIIFLR